MRGRCPRSASWRPLEDTMVVFLHGPVWADITGAEGSERISGQQAVTWVDHIVRAPFQLLSVGSGEPPVKADPRSDLRAGRVPGSGFVLTPAGSGSRAARSSPTAGRRRCRPPRPARPRRRPPSWRRWRPSPLLPLPSRQQSPRRRAPPEPPPAPEPTSCSRAASCPRAGGCSGHRAAGRNRCPRHDRPRSDTATPQAARAGAGGGAGAGGRDGPQPAATLPHRVRCPPMPPCS